jgi:uncharacterized protein (DUF934 family)
MPLLKHNAIVPDTWTELDGDAPLPAAGDIIVPLARLLKEKDALLSRRNRLGVRLGNKDRLDSLAGLLPDLAAIVLPFPAFNDGRAYSLARKLRELGYQGELRASGNILPDQLQFMLQVGFDAFEIGDRFPLEMWSKAARQMSLAYQRGLFRRDPEADIWTERHSDAEPWLEQPHAG